MMRRASSHVSNPDTGNRSAAAPLDAHTADLRTTNKQVINRLLSLYFFSVVGFACT